MTPTQAPAVALLVLASACIIPDREITTETVPGNPGAVRIVEPTNLTAQLIADCKDGESTACSQVPSGRRSGLVSYVDEAGTSLPLCICPIGSRDNRSIPEFFVYAEDPDRSRPRASEALFAVALLDVDPLSTSPQNFVAYEEQFEVAGVGQPLDLGDLDAAQLTAVDLDDDDEPLLSPSLGREDSGLFRFRFGKNNGAGTDLCNDDNGAKLSPGLHTLQIMVTDRPFFRPQLYDALGRPVVGVDGKPQLAPPQPGMPDIAAGATWAIANYVFECIVEEVDVDQDASVCDCTEVGAP